MNKCVNLQNLDSSKNFVLSFKPNVNLLTGLFFFKIMHVIFLINKLKLNFMILKLRQNTDQYTSKNLKDKIIIKKRRLNLKL